MKDNRRNVKKKKGLVKWMCCYCDNVKYEELENYYKHMEDKHGWKF